MARKPLPSPVDDAVTPERIERAIVAVAKFMLKRGPVYAPILERLERELIEARRNDPMAHARRILAAYEHEAPHLPAPPALLPPPR